MTKGQLDVLIVVLMLAFGVATALVSYYGSLEILRRLASGPVPGARFPRRFALIWTVVCCTLLYGGGIIYGLYLVNAH